jgi:hypothetical protein
LQARIPPSVVSYLFPLISYYRSLPPNTVCVIKERERELHMLMSIPTQSDDDDEREKDRNMRKYLANAELAEEKGDDDEMSRIL